MTPTPRPRYGLRRDYRTVGVSFAVLPLVGRSNRDIPRVLGYSLVSGPDRAGLTMRIPATMTLSIAACALFASACSHTLPALDPDAGYERPLDYEKIAALVQARVDMPSDLNVPLRRFVEKVNLIGESVGEPGILTESERRAQIWFNFACHRRLEMNGFFVRWEPGASNIEGRTQEIVSAFGLERGSVFETSRPALSGLRFLECKTRNEIATLADRVFRYDPEHISGVSPVSAGGSPP